MLTKLGYQVIESDSPEQALEIVNHDHRDIHLLLTDVVMPRTNGFDLARSIHAVRREIRVLYMSGYTDHRLTSSWMIEPGTPLLQKPFSAAALDQRIRELLGGKTAGSDAQSEG
jgi:DNA-binding NtrC family response regulator